MPKYGDEPNYLVLDTDYDTYSIVYNCSQVSRMFTFDLLWVLAREKTLDQDTLESIKETIKEKLPEYDLES